MTDPSSLTVFILTFFFVSITPGLCMTLSLTLGIYVGVRRALVMMVGELMGVALVTALAILGVAAFVQRYPTELAVVTVLGGIYLIYIGIQMWRADAKLSPEELQSKSAVSGKSLMLQGFTTAVANPKAWAFSIALLPPFVDYSQALAPQLIQLIGIILLIEFSCLMIYACGGRALRQLLMNSGNVAFINRIAGTLITVVGVWLIFGVGSI